MKNIMTIIYNTIYVFLETGWVDKAAVIRALREEVSNTWQHNK